MILQIGLQVLLPTFLLVCLWREKYGSWTEWLLNVLAVGATLIFVFLTARWDFTSYYLRFLLPVLLAAAAYNSQPRHINARRGCRANATAAIRTALDRCKHAPRNCAQHLGRW